MLFKDCLANQPSEQRKKENSRDDQNDAPHRHDRHDLVGVSAARRTQRKKPDIQPQLSYYQPLQLIIALENGDIDMAVTYHYAYSSMGSFEYKDFIRERSALCVGKRDPLDRRESLSLSELSDNTFVVLRSQPYVSHVLKLLKESGITEPKLVYCDQIDALDYTINRVGGAAVMPRSIKNMTRSDMTLIPVTDRHAVFPVCAIYKKGNKNAAIPIVLEMTERLFGR